MINQIILFVLGDASHFYHLPDLRLSILDITLSGGTTENKLTALFKWSMKILNILVIIGAVYAGAGIANSMFGLSGDDHYAGKGKGKLMALVFGLIIWFGIQVIIGDIGNTMKN